MYACIYIYVYMYIYTYEHAHTGGGDMYALQDRIILLTRSVNELQNMAQDSQADRDQVLQHTATHCNTLQHTATQCNTMQHTATHCNTLQHTATHCNTLQRTDVWSMDTVQHIAARDRYVS